MKILKFVLNTFALFLIVLVIYVACEIRIFQEIHSLKYEKVQYSKMVEYYKNGNYIKSVKYHIYLRSSVVPFAAQEVSYANKAAILDALGMHKKSIEILQGGIEKVDYPFNNILTDMLVMRYLSDKNYPEIEKTASYALARGANPMYLYWQLGDLYLEFNEPQRAITAYTEAIKYAKNEKNEKKRNGALNALHQGRIAAYNKCGTKFKK